jgi:hypothetical protein
MGRPIKTKFFGNRNYPYDNENTGGRSGVGAESVTTPIQILNTGSLYSAGATLTFSAPDIAGGVRATGTPVISQPGSGGITSINLTNAGTGYSNTATITVNKPASVTLSAVLSTTTSTISSITTAGIYIGMRLDGSPGMPTNNYVTAIGANSVKGTFNFTANTTTAVTFSDQGSGLQTNTALTSNRQNSIQIISYLTTGSSGISGGDIMKQEGSRRYLVQNAQGQGICKLSTGTLAAGQMHIIATDVSGATYWVTKLTSRKATVYPRTNTSTAIYRSIHVAPWTIGNASGTTTGTAIISLSHTV